MRYSEIFEAKYNPDTVAAALFKKFGGKTMPYNKLPPTAKKAITQYMIIDGDREDYKKLQYGIVNIPTDVLVKEIYKRFVHDEYTHCDNLDDFKKSIMDEGIGIEHQEVWPVFIGKDVLEDGMHRLGVYIRSNLASIPCVMVR